MAGLRRFLSAERGALLLETALVTPVLLVLFIAVAQFGFAFYVQATLQSAVRSATRDAAIDEATVSTASPPVAVACDAPPAVGTVEEVVCGYLSNTNLFADQSSFSVVAEQADYDNETPNTSDDVGDMLFVTAIVPLDQVVFIDFNGFLTSGRSLSAYATMQREP